MSDDLKPQAKFAEYGDASPKVGEAREFAGNVLTYQTIDVPTGRKVLHVELKEGTTSDEAQKVILEIVKHFQPGIPFEDLPLVGDEGSEVIYRGHGGVLVATKKVENWRGEMVPGHYYEMGDAEECLQVTTFQNGPVPEVGHNGTTSECEIAMLIHRTEELNKLFPCEENERAIGHLKDALAAFEERTAKRLQRGVEGKLVV